MEVIKILLKGQTVTDIGYYFLLDVDRFYGIEYEEFPAQIARVAMWLIDHTIPAKLSAGVTSVQRAITHENKELIISFDLL
jgi:hypothetical protein